MLPGPDLRPLQPSAVKMRKELTICPSVFTLGRRGGIENLTVSDIGSAVGDLDVGVADVSPGDSDRTEPA